MKDFAGQNSYCTIKVNLNVLPLQYYAINMFLVIEI